MQKADVILKNANIITMDSSQSRAELIAIQGDKILLVTGKEQLDQVQTATTKVIDCEGKTVVPGFNDAHCHMFSLVRKLLSFDLSPSKVRSINEIKAVVRQQACQAARGKWLIGTDYNDFYLDEKRHPNRHDLDEAAPDHPVLLMHRSLHACVLNSLALALAGIAAETPEPPGGLISRKVDSGEPDGVLFDMLSYIRERVLPPLTEDEIIKGIRLVNRHYLSHGITSLQDASVTNDFKRWQTFCRLIESGRLKSRLSMMLGVASLSQFQERGLRTGSGNSQIRLGAVKIILNETTGKLFPSQIELEQQAFAAHQAGFQLAIHAIEQSCVEAAVSAFERLNGQDIRTRARHRIEHCSECPSVILKRLSRLQPIIVTQSPFLYYNGERYLSTIPAQELRWLYPIKSLLHNHLIVANSSDSPVVPNNPLIGMYAAVTRRAESGQQLTLQECITPNQALAMYSINAAYASFEEDIKGSITPGKMADIAVLSDDPTKSTPEKIKDIKVLITIIGGKVVWEA